VLEILIPKAFRTPSALPCDRSSHFFQDTEPAQLQIRAMELIRLYPVDGR